MEQYGSYEVVRELTSARGSVVYLARKKEEGVPAAEGVIVKTFSSAEIIGGDTQLWRRGEVEASPHKKGVYADPEAFLDAVRKQQKASVQGSPHIAPVLGFGKDERGAWYATNFYPRSIKKIIEGRVSLSAEGFFNVIRSITRGLLEFKNAGGQSHGNLKPSNVLISGHGKIRRAEVVLVDPAPDTPGELPDYEISDLHAIGEIMYQLVRRKEVEGTAHWPLLPSREWSSLFGEAADAWRELCNKLIDPELSVHPMTLEDLEPELAKLEPKPPVSTPVLAAIVAAVLLLSAASYFLVSHFAGGKYGSIEITSAPTGAEVLLNGQKVGSTPYRDRKIVPGEVSYLLKLESHDDYRIKTNLSAKTEAKLHLVLSRHTGTVVLNSDPPGAEILTNGIVIGRTPSTNTLLTGTHTLTLRYPNLKEQRLIVPVENRQVTSNSLEFPRGEIRFRSEPTGAKLVIAGRAIGNTPINVVVDPGPVSIELQLPGYNTATVKTNVLVKDRLDLRITLSEGQGIIALRSDPAGAAVFWNDRPQGSTPVRLTLPRGRQELVLKYGNLREQRQTLEVEKDKEKPIAMRFPRATLVVDSDPSGALVLMGTNVLGITPTNFFVEPGMVNLELKADDFSGTLNTNLAPDAIAKVRLPLSVGRGKVYVMSDPPGENVFSSDGKLLGPTESSIELSKGAHGLIARHPLHTDWEEQRFSVVVEKDKTKTNEVVKFPYGDLVLRSQPPGATILEDGKKVGVTPHTNFFMKPGPAAYELKLEDYLMAVITTNIVAGQTLAVDLVLKRARGTMVFTSEPPGARIFVDGSELGTAPCTNSLPTGAYLVRARFSNLPEQTTNILVRLGDEITVPFHFDVPIKIKETIPAADSITAAETMTNSIGMILVKVRDDLWVGQSKVTIAQFEIVMGDLGLRNRQPAKPAEVSWTDAITFCGALAGEELRLGKLRAHLSYSLPKTNDWRDIVQNRGSANVLGDVGIKAAGNAGEWCFTTKGGLVQRAPTIVVTDGGKGELKIVPLKPLDKDTVGPNFRCVLAPPRDDK